MKTDEDKNKESVSVIDNDLTSLKKSENLHSQLS